jgi:hypothetical protein
MASGVLEKTAPVMEFELDVTDQTAIDNSTVNTVSTRRWKTESSPHGGESMM